MIGIEGEIVVLNKISSFIEDRFSLVNGNL